MTRREFVRDLERQLEMPEGTLDGNPRLNEIGGWDSLAVVLFIAMANEKAGVILSGDDVGNSKTLDDLLALLGSQLTP